MIALYHRQADLSSRRSGFSNRGTVRNRAPAHKSIARKQKKEEAVASSVLFFDPLDRYRVLVAQVYLLVLRRPHIGEAPGVCVVVAVDDPIDREVCRVVCECCCVFHCSSSLFVCEAG